MPTGLWDYNFVERVSQRKAGRPKRDRSKNRAARRARKGNRR